MTTVRDASPSSIRLPRSFYAWMTGALASQLGDAVLLFALGWAASAHGGMWAGVVLAAGAAPRTLLLLAGGVLADRVSALAVMVVGDAVMVALAVALAIAAAFVGTPVWLLMAFAVVAGTVGAFYAPASGTMPRRLVGPDGLPRALAMRSTGAQLLGLVSAPVGGVLVAWAGMTGAASLDAVTFAVVLVVLVKVRPVVPHDANPAGSTMRKHFVREAGEGLRFAWADPVLRAGLFLTGAVAGLALPVATLLLPLLARSHGWGSGVAGLILGFQAAGSIAASVVVARWGQRGRPLAVGTLSTLPMALGLMVLALAPEPALACVGALLLGTGLGLFVSHIGPLLLSASPQTHLSRVQSIIALVQSVALLVTNSLLGGLAQATSAPWTLVAAGTLLGLAGAVVASIPLRSR